MSPGIFAEVGERYLSNPGSDPYSYSQYADSLLENTSFVVNLPVNGILSFKIFAESEEEAIRKGEEFIKARYVKEGEE